MFLSTFIVSLIAIGLDRILSEVKKYHPLVGFGNYASLLETKFNHSKNSSKYIGFVVWCLAVLPFVILTFLIQHYLVTMNHIYLEKIFDIIILYFAIGRSSLFLHAMNVYIPLCQKNQESLKTAREQISLMVSRETQHLNEQEVSRATVESVLENGHDAITASLIWYAIGGAPLVILHRLVNTLDAMWGYKNKRFVQFGWFSARVDDWLGWPSAKITSFLYALNGLFRGKFYQSLYNAAKQAPLYKSLNGGWVMASGATALNTSLVGSATYDTKVSTSTILGQGNAVNQLDIIRSIRLVSISVFIWLFFLLFFSFITGEF